MKSYTTKRHIEIGKKLTEIASKLENTTEIYTAIAKKLKIGVTTVFNYCNGRIKDGYLAEDIEKLLLTYKK